MSFFDVEEFGFETCKWMSILARDIMIARQQDKPMSETLPYALDRLNDFPNDMIDLIDPETSEDLDDVELAVMEVAFGTVSQEFKPMITQLVMGTYEVPTYDSQGLRRDAISDAENTIFAGCYTEYEEEAARLDVIQTNAETAYMFAIQRKINRNWVRPPTAKDGIECIVNVRQLPGGEVVSVTIGTCNGDSTVRRSIEAAVHKASPLPAPSDPSVFDRNLRLEFRPGD